MYSYLDVGRWFNQIGLIQQIIKYTNVNNLIPMWFTIKFKLALFTVPAHAWACSVTCDPCQPTKL